MADAKRDGNRVPVILATSSVDGDTLINVTINPANNALSVEDNTTGSDLTDRTTIQRDENRKVAFWAVSSADGVTPVAVYCDADGKLLINSN